MASYPDDHVFQSSLRSPARDAHDSRSCAITRGSVPSDMVAFGSQHGSAGPGLVQQRFATIQYPGTKELLVPRDGVTPGWHEEFTNLIAQHKRSHILREEPDVDICYANVDGRFCSVRMPLCARPTLLPPLRHH